MHRVGDYDVAMHRVIGAGSFAKVYSGFNRQTGEEVAVKRMDRHKVEGKDKLQQNLKGEINIMKTLRHPNIVHLYDTVVRRRVGGPRVCARGALRRGRHLYLRIYSPFRRALSPSPSRTRARRPRRSGRRTAST
jgi:serine/threonine protein kinase